MARPPTATCSVRGCTAGIDARCVEGFTRADDCPQFAPDSRAWLELPEGGDLDTAAAERVARAAPTRVILLAGAADSGKTTLLAALYEAFQRGPFAGYAFAGSESLLGFERRCYLGRIDCGWSAPDTARTSVAIGGQRWLHLRVRASRGAGPPRDLLFSEVGGDFVRLAKDSTDECRRLTVARRADHFAILVDGEKLVQRQHRLVTANDGALLLRSCLDADTLGRASFVDVLFTKWDAVMRSPERPEVERFLEAFVARTRQHCETRLGRLRFVRVAARPEVTSPVGFAHGLAELLASWTQESPLFAPGRAVTVPLPVDGSEFDRFLWRQLPALRPEG